MVMGAHQNTTKCKGVVLNFQRKKFFSPPQRSGPYQWNVPKTSRQSSQQLPFVGVVTIRWLKASARAHFFWLISPQMNIQIINSSYSTVTLSLEIVVGEVISSKWGDQVCVVAVSVWRSVEGGTPHSCYFSNGEVSFGGPCNPKQRQKLPSEFLAPVGWFDSTTSQFSREKSPKIHFETDPHSSCTGHLAAIFFKFSKKKQQTTDCNYFGLVWLAQTRKASARMRTFADQAVLL